MGDRVVLHIGTMKSGTSYVQSLLKIHRDALDEEGVSFLGGSFGAQTRAVRGVIQKAHKSGEDPRGWAALAGEARAHDGHTSVVSMEFLSFAGPAHIAQLLEPFSGLDVRVVITVRDQFRAIPAQWQTYTRNLGVEDWVTYLRQIAASDLGGLRESRAHRTFHRAQDVVTMLDRWGRRPEVRDVVVATVPPPGAPRDELWKRFCEAAGIPALEAPAEGLRDNPSLGYASCDYLRRINVHFSDVPPRRYRKGIRPLSRDVLVHLRHEEGRPELDEGGAEFARSHNDRIRTALARGQHRVVGSLADLPVPDTLADHPAEVSAPPREQVMRAALAAWDHAAERLEGSAGTRPDDLDELVAQSAAMIRRANGWTR